MRSVCAVLCLLALSMLWTGASCTCTDPCKCNEDGVDIDFAEASNSHFANQNLTEDKYIYTISPCAAITCNFTDEDPTSKAVGCQYVLDKNSFFVLGRINDVTWNITNASIFNVIYGSGDPANSLPRRVRIDFTVSKDVKEPSIEYVSDEVANGFEDYTFEARLNMKDADKGISGGSVVGIAGLVIMMLLLVAVVAYFVVGSIVMYQVKGARGVEMIPHYAFWKGLPILVKDGFLFTISPCRKKFGGYQSL